MQGPTPRQLSILRFPTDGPVKVRERGRSRPHVAGSTPIWPMGRRLADAMSDGEPAVSKSKGGQGALDGFLLDALSWVVAWLIWSN